MYVELLTDAAALYESDNLKSLDVRTALTGNELDAAVAATELGLVDSGRGHIWLDPATLLALAGITALDPEWVQDFTGMVAFAESNGWNDAEGRVRAHISAVTGAGSGATADTVDAVAGIPGHTAGAGGTGVVDEPAAAADGNSVTADAYADDAPADVADVEPTASVGQAPTRARHAAEPGA